MLKGTTYNGEGRGGREKKGFKKKYFNKPFKICFKPNKNTLGVKRWEFFKGKEVPLLCLRPQWES